MNARLSKQRLTSFARGEALSYGNTRFIDIGISPVPRPQTGALPGLS